MKTFKTASVMAFVAMLMCMDAAYGAVVWKSGGVSQVTIETAYIGKIWGTNWVHTGTNKKNTSGNMSVHSHEVFFPKGSKVDSITDVAQGERYMWRDKTIPPQDMFDMTNQWKITSSANKRGVSTSTTNFPEFITWPMESGAPSYVGINKTMNGAGNQRFLGVYTVTFTLDNSLDDGPHQIQFMVTNEKGETFTAYSPVAAAGETIQVTPTIGMLRNAAARPEFGFGKDFNFGSITSAQPVVPTTQ